MVKKPIDRENLFLSIFDVLEIVMVVICSINNWNRSQSKWIFLWTTINQQLQCCTTENSRYLLSECNWVDNLSKFGYHCARIAFWSTSFVLRLFSMRPILWLSNAYANAHFWHLRIVSKLLWNQQPFFTIYLLKWTDVIDGKTK